MAVQANMALVDELHAGRCDACTCETRTHVSRINTVRVGAHPAQAGLCLQSAKRKGCRGGGYDTLPKLGLYLAGLGWRGG